MIRGGGVAVSRAPPLYVGLASWILGFRDCLSGEFEVFTLSFLLQLRPVWATSRGVDSAKVTVAQLRSIIFEGRSLPRSVMAISLLANVASKSDRDLAKWLRTFPNCRGDTFCAPSLECFTFAGRARDLMLDRREAVLSTIAEVLQPAGLDAQQTYAEWITALQLICELSARTEDDCEWYAPANPSDAPIVSKQMDAMRRYLNGSE